MLFLQSGIRISRSTSQGMNRFVLRFATRNLSHRSTAPFLVGFLRSGSPSSESAETTSRKENARVNSSDNINNLNEKDTVRDQELEDLQKESRDLDTKLQAAQEEVDHFREIINVKREIKAKQEKLHEQKGLIMYLKRNAYAEKS
ncbi:hypothetical protein BT96DRAFT_308534 [Gymnopus androsaceus JB14]|uniref:Uncharacterized protein n=1 Tax=Gymnopus androsaceus JB14 TaxID=1447944 RepID=A0A6A4H1F4_9AGAR|nr:hypothetical protein BT96DRAFT_308534 [Gymnopus androsaceus JB14]